MSASAKALLRMKHDEVNLADLGSDSTTLYYPTGKAALLKYSAPSSILLQSNGYLESCRRFACAQAILDGISTTMHGLALRPIFPDLDLQHPNGKVPSRRWTQTYYGESEFKDTWQIHGELIYISNRQTMNDRHVMLIFGVEDLSEKDRPLFTQSITFTRGNVTVTGIYDIQGIKNVIDKTMFFRTPILYKKNDDAAIYFHGDTERIEHLGLMGFIVEPLGQTQTG